MFLFMVQWLTFSHIVIGSADMGGLQHNTALVGECWLSHFSFYYFILFLICRMWCDTYEKINQMEFKVWLLKIKARKKIAKLQSDATLLNSIALIVLAFYRLTLKYDHFASFISTFFRLSDCKNVKLCLSLV